jgi:hypothetical protein
MTAVASPALKDPSPLRSRAVTGEENGKYVNICTIGDWGLEKMSVIA